MSGNSDQYNEYNRILRSWFVAFGVGGPVVFLTNAEVRQQLIDSGDMRLVITLFLLGAAAQIFIAFVNKVVNWYANDGGDEKYRLTRRYRYACAVIEWFFLDLLIDVGSFAMFGWAVWLVFGSFID